MSTDGGAAPFPKLAPPYADSARVGWQVHRNDAIIGAPISAVVGRFADPPAPAKAYDLRWSRRIASGDGA